MINKLIVCVVLMHGSCWAQDLSVGNYKYTDASGCYFEFSISNNGNTINQLKIVVNDTVFASDGNGLWLHSHGVDLGGDVSHLGWYEFTTLEGDHYSFKWVKDKTYRLLGRVDYLLHPVGYEPGTDKGSDDIIVLQEIDNVKELRDYEIQLDDAHEKKIISSEACFPGGQREMYLFIKRHLKYPRKSRRKKNEAVVKITFWLDAVGEMSNFKAENEDYPRLNKEAIRVLKKMPQWEPVTFEEYRVASEVSVAFRFYTDEFEPVKKKRVKKSSKGGVRFL